MSADHIEQFVSSLPFDLDPFQREAIHALAAGRSVLVAAPTGTGKTVVAEFAAHLALSRGLRAIYTTPLKALSNQKFRDFRVHYGSEVGLMTGDLVENPGGRLLVMTTEVARNMLVQDPGSFRDVGCLIFDEVHYLADPERGTAWEESILLAPAHVPLVSLSATVANAAEVADWIGSTGRDVALVESSLRAVPLKHRYFLDGVLHPILDGESPLPPGARTQQGGRPQTGRGRAAAARNGRNAATPEAMEVDPPAVVKALAAEALLPAIYFLFSRRSVEEAAESCRRLSLLSGGEASEVRRIAHARLAGLGREDRALLQVQRLLGLLPRGVGFHHAGMLPPLKTLVEELLADGRLKVVFATDTLALGINVPARSVVVGEMVKFDGRNRRLILPGEYRQLTGRAGRRGMDPVGYSVLLHSPWVGLDQAAEIATGDVAPLESAFRPGYSTVLNLWPRPGEVERLEPLLAGSLRQFQQGQEIRSLVEERDALASALAGLPPGCPLDGGTVNWLEQDKRLRRERDRAESALEAATRDATNPRRARDRAALEAATRKLAATRERLRAASTALARSPCRSCHLRADHRRSERQRVSYAGQLAAVERDLGSVRVDARRRAERTLRALRSVLGTFGYLADGQLTPKARVLMRLFDSNGLVISELLDWGVLADASAPELAEVASWFAFDREGAGRALSTSERLARMRTAAETVAKGVLEVERRFGVALSVPLSPGFRGVALGWAAGTSLADLSARSGLAEGDLVFALQKTIDLCRQISQAAAHCRTPKLARRASEAAGLLRRGVVDSYYRWVVVNGQGAVPIGERDESDARHRGESRDSRPHDLDVRRGEPRVEAVDPVQA